MLSALAANAEAQDFVTQAIKSAIVKVIKAVDLKIQRLQNETIRLQNAQKAIENTLTKLKLAEISDWVEQQRKQYADYYEELWKVKSAINYYRDVRAIIQKQKDLVEEYKRTSALFRNDKNFSIDELEYMEQVYQGMVKNTLNSVDLLMLVANAFTTQMSDAERLVLINEAGDNIDNIVTDLKVFNNSNMLLSLQRAKDANEIQAIKTYYGLQ